MILQLYRSAKAKAIEVVIKASDNQECTMSAYMGSKLATLRINQFREN